VIDVSAIPLSLYVHIPWCVKKCPYCDFNSHAANGKLPESEYVDALLADLAQERALAAGRRIGTVFFGGGTPSLFAPDSIARILDGADALVPFADGAEVTLETNPGTVEHGRFDGYRDAGVNRVSFGVQSFDDGALARIGRIHGAAEARDAVRQAQDAGIAEINLDLMYALPGQDEGAALRDVDEALALAPTHVSHYQLTLEPNTLFAAKPPKLPDDDAAWSMQERAQAALAAGGYTQYEVSAYARGGAQCAHNLNYWRFGDYFGIGAGAHAKLTRADGAIVRTSKKKMPRSYLDSATGPARLASDATIEAAQLPFEFMLNALRLEEGFELASYEQRTGLPRATLEPALTRCVERGWLVRDDERIVPTPLGRRFLNDVIEAFLP
jgi:putative oxygen-independent coproporphyrinogen III oxidase